MYMISTYEHTCMQSCVKFLHFLERKMKDLNSLLTIRYLSCTSAVWNITVFKTYTGLIHFYVFNTSAYMLIRA